MTPDTPDKEPLVHIEKLYKSFEHRGVTINVLSDLNLRVDRGEMCAVMGASGAGKSTFLHVLGTLDAPTSGTITVAGRDVTGLSEKELARFRNNTIGFVFQFHHLLPEFTALENTMMPGLIRRLDREALEQDAVRVLGEVGLSHRMTHKPSELSGGEQQRVALARALVLRPPLLLADEPTGNLDAKTSEAIHELFFAMNEKFGTTMLLVTHNVELASRMPRTLRLVDGKIENELSGQRSVMQHHLPSGQPT